MKLHRSLSTVPVGRCLGYVLIFLSVVASSFAGASFTPINSSGVSRYEPYLIGRNLHPGSPNPSVIETLYGEANVRRINDEYDRVFVFTEDVATFKVVALFAANQSHYLSVVNPDLWKTDLVLDIISADFGYDLQPPTEFVVSKEDYVAELRLVSNSFCSDPDYALWNHNDRKGPNQGFIVDNKGVDQMVTFEIVGNQGHPDNPVGSYVIAWEDEYRMVDWSTSGDFQDFVVEVTGIAPIPEPPSAVLVLLSVGAGLVKAAQRWWNFRQRT